MRGDCSNTDQIEDILKELCVTFWLYLNRRCEVVVCFVNIGGFMTFIV
jgi:hypothetical protein